MIDWSDLRIVLAVARAGSALRAAQALGVNQTTVVRRIAQLEAAIGASLFERKQSGYHPTPLGQRVAAVAGRIEEEVTALESDVDAKQRTLAGTVRLTTSEALASHLVTPLLPDFRKTHAGILIELVADDRRFDLARGDAEVALRTGSRPDGAGIVARRLPNVAWSVYCSRSYADEWGAPSAIEALDGHPIIGFDGALGSRPAPLFLVRAAPNSKVSARSNSLANLVSALKAGLGIAMLPCLVGDAEPGLVRCLPPVKEVDSEMWLIVREEVKSAPHVRAFADFLAMRIQSMRGPLAGEADRVRAES
ncbi:LysR family transcriptional regulator [Pseudorhodoplanes sp.]|uniref:LysR family transcriptional regulator n=1 Tax=Pseudorhodoplanes sp. TaxID=1934341 RepID=UPI002CACA661|nr:LysR family transcriptional regulator [Pseudorhodoplanes sp.]HWV52883.1 LysR family transcriptional regulator [Pseudorhodoplanes sp.]